MSTLARAIIIATKAHEGQTDKAGLPYITHPLRVMQLVKTPQEKIVAVLHDIVEDTTVTIQDLMAEGFDADVLRAIDLLTHKKGEMYHEYVFRLKGDPIATAVKLADLTDNTRIDRVIMRPGKIPPDSRRLIKYVMSYKYLTDEIDYDAYKKALEAHV